MEFALEKKTEAIAIMGKGNYMKQIDICGGFQEPKAEHSCGLLWRRKQKQ